MMNEFVTSSVFNWHSEGIPYLSFEMLDNLGYPNLYTSRYSRYDMANKIAEKGFRAALMKDDDRAEAVPVLVRNFSDLAVQLGADPSLLRTTNQKHTSRVIALGEDDLGLDISFANQEPIDGMVTDVPGAGLIVFGADCPSVYIVDPVHHAIGLVHAGWRGTLGKIPAVAIDMMRELYGSSPEDMYAAIGPSICENCYEMGDEVFDAFESEWSRADAETLMKRHDSGRYHLNLWKANRMTLERCGLKSEHIAVTDVCTCCNVEHFYSYRAHRMENEQCAMLVNTIRTER